MSPLSIHLIALCNLKKPLEPFMLTRRPDPASGGNFSLARMCRGSLSAEARLQPNQLLGCLGIMRFRTSTSLSFEPWPLFFIEF